MSKYIEKYEFSKKPSKIIYKDGEPLKLSNEFNFFHNKNKFRKELNRLQYLLKKFTGNSLVASGIRDSFLKEEFTKKYLLILFTNNETIKKANTIIEKHADLNLSKGCFYLETNSKYLMLLSQDMDGLRCGVEILEDILSQTFEDYIKQKVFDDYVKIRPFELFNCD
ncbi:MAG: hypothetical protein ACFE85_06705 [Candidatus Hodarchaeota archaeon]